MSLTSSLDDRVPLSPPEGAGDRWPWLDRLPESIAHPSSTEEVADTLRWASGNGIGVAPQASGSRWRGPRHIDRPFIALSTDRLVGIDIYEPADLTLTARAGTPLPDVGAALRAHGQWLPYDPPRVDEGSVGGLVALGESGPLWMGYGELRNHVLGATVVTGDGKVLRLGGRVVKNVAGFDLLKAIVGSRGRLGVITSVCVRAFPVPTVDRVLALRGDAPPELMQVAGAVGTATVMPVSSVIVSPAPSLGAGAALLVRLHGAEPTVEDDQRTIERHTGVSFERVSDVPAVLTTARDHASEADLVLTISVLPSRLPEALAVVRGEVGDAPAIIDTYRGTLRVGLDRYRVKAAARLPDRIGSLRGTVSARAHVRDVDAAAATSSLSKAEAGLTSGLENVFDPQGVFWPCRA